MTSETDKELLLSTAALIAQARKVSSPGGSVTFAMTHKAAERLARVLREAAEGWRLIETAPHGVVVLLAWRDSFLPQWSYEAGFASHGTRYPNGASSMSLHGQATHWRPLPPPPSPEPATHSLEGDR